MDYDRLKKILYQTEQATIHAGRLPTSSPSRLAIGDEEEAEHFLRACYEELEKINTFYHQQEASLQATFEHLVPLYRSLCHNEGKAPAETILPFLIHDKEEDDGEQHTLPQIASSATLTPQRRERQTSTNAVAISHRVEALFIQLSDLRDYVDLNYTGFSKIFKKHQKLEFSNL